MPPHKRFGAPETDSDDACGGPKCGNFIAVNPIVGRVALRGLLAALVLVAILWIGDFVSFRYRLSKGTAGLAVQTMRVQRTYAIPHKDGRAEYVFGEPQMVSCARSIFPHAGYTPCWYLQKTVAKPVQM